MNIVIYTDGSSLGNPGPGGWGVIIHMLDNSNISKEIPLSGGEKMSTNNRMELLAVIKSLTYILEDRGVEVSSFAPKKSGGQGLFTDSQANIQDSGGRPQVNDMIQVFTDSQYVQKGVEERLATRVRRGWRLSKGGKTIKNVDLWQQLHSLLPYFSDLQWQRVKGHAGHRYNEKVDKLAKEAAQQQ